jgi:hypothetical protein
MRATSTGFDAKGVCNDCGRPLYVHPWDRKDEVYVCGVRLPGAKIKVGVKVGAHAQVIRNGKVVQE